MHLFWIKTHHPSENHNLAFNRLNTTVKRLKAQSLYQKYAAVFKSWLKEGILEEVQDKQKV